MSTLFGALLIVSVGLSTCSVNDYQHVCGQQLVNMLHVVCGGRGFHWTHAGERHAAFKRSALQQLIPKPLKRQSGIYEECCVRSCSMMHMETYCASQSAANDPDISSGATPEHLVEEETNFDIATVHTFPSNGHPRPLPTRRPLPFRHIPVGYIFVRHLAPRPTRPPVTSP